MSASQEDSAEKSHQPTERRLEEARRKGDVPRSMEVTALAALVGLALALGQGGGWMMSRAGTALGIFLSEAGSLAEQVFAGGGGGLAWGGILAAAVPAGLMFLGPAVLVVAALAAQRAVTFAPSKLAPKLNRISPIAGFRNRFGASGIVGFLRSLAKLVVTSVVAGLFLLGDIGRIAGLSLVAPEHALAVLADSLVRFLWAIAAVTAVIAAFDYLWQRYDHQRKLRMSRQELKEERKQTEGDPDFKQERRRRGQQIATRKMLAEVPAADVVIVNPQHYAVALKWDRKPGSAPVCVAKGVDEIAARIREVAARAGVPIHRDPPTARAIHAAVEIGQEILPEHYRAVAAAIRYAERMRTLSRHRFDPGRG